MQFTIEAESKSKAEAMRMRKKLELDIGELVKITQKTSLILKFKNIHFQGLCP